MKVALVHDWLTGMRGGELVLEAIAELFPKTEIFTLLSVPASVSAPLTAITKHTSWLQKVPRAQHRYRYFLPLMPSMIESFDLTGYDLVISSSHCVAKGIRKPAGAVHISYVHAPMRYVWDRFDDYFGPGRSSFPVRMAASLWRKKLQDWDRRVSQDDRVDHLIANSDFIAEQIQAHYGRSAQVIHPFAKLERFSIQDGPRSGYLMVGAFAPYKRIDLAIEAFNRLGLRLVIIGGGQDQERLKKKAGPSIEFLGPLSNRSVEDFFSRSKGFIFPGKEDFGITPVEAMASGCPVIAFGEGGICDTVTDETGIFFDEQTVESLVEAVNKFERGEVKISPDACRKQAQKFVRSRFQQEFRETVRKVWQNAGKDFAELEKAMV